jgi:large subunit ribosomal protein L18
MTAKKVAGRVVTRRSGAAAGSRQVARRRRHLRLRRKVVGTTQRPRLVVTRSNRHIVAQIVDDSSGRTLVSASSMDSTVRALSADKTERAKAVGALVAQRATAADIEQVVFDRGGNRYHGRIAALADGVREGGVQF